MSVQHNYLKLISAIGAIYLQTSRNYQARLCCKKLGTSRNVKGFAIGSFLERIVERANNTGLISAKPIDFQRNLAKFSLKFLAKFPRNWPIFPRQCP